MFLNITIRRVGNVTSLSVHTVCNALILIVLPICFEEEIQLFPALFTYFLLYVLPKDTERKQCIEEKMGLLFMYYCVLTI